MGQITRTTDLRFGEPKCTETDLIKSLICPISGQSDKNDIPSYDLCVIHSLTFTRKTSQTIEPRNVTSVLKVGRFGSNGTDPRLFKKYGS